MDPGIAGINTSMHPGDDVLVRTLVGLAELPDEAAELEDHLSRLVDGIVTGITAVDYASVTWQRDDSYSTVALTGEVALAVDEAQYEAGEGPCIEAAEGNLTSVPDVATIVKWPAFREAAASMGLRSSLSIPLFTASGMPSIA